MSVFKTWDLWRQAYAAAGYVDDEEQDMTTLREAAAQALEALEWYAECSMVVEPAAAAIDALRAALAEPPDSTKPVVESETASEPVQERNFCSRCGKRTNDIHTCTPPLADGDNLSPTGCDHCNHPLYAAIKCSQCGRVTE